MYKIWYKIVLCVILVKCIWLLVHWALSDEIACWDLWVTVYGTVCALSKEYNHNIPIIAHMLESPQNL